VTPSTPSMARSVDYVRLTEWFQRFKRWRAPLRKLLIARGSGGAHDLDDVAQEVFLRLLRYGNTELIEHPQSYLFRMAANVAGEWALLVRHRYPHDERWLADLPAEGQPEHEVACEAAHREFREALERLPPRQREVLRLHFGEELTRAAIAARLKVSERVVKRDLILAYAALRTPRNAELAQLLGVDLRGDSHGL
jgi:RNA polymerase sigma factor (sigma-70 family)